MPLKEMKTYRRDALMGSLGALLMLVGDLCLSVIPPDGSDTSLFVREAYLSGSWESWRLPLLIWTALFGMPLEFFAVRVFYRQVLPQYRKTRRLLLLSFVIILTSAATLHFLIGSLADWTTVLSPILGREETIALVDAEFKRMISAMLLPYIGLVILFLVSAFAVITKKTILPQKMILLHMIVFQLIFVLIPDIRHFLGAEVSTWDYVLSQGSTNASLAIWMIVNAMWAESRIRRIQTKDENDNAVIEGAEILKKEEEDEGQ